MQEGHSICFNDGKRTCVKNLATDEDFETLSSTVATTLNDANTKISGLESKTNEANIAQDAKVKSLEGSVTRFISHTP